MRGHMHFDFASAAWSVITVVVGVKAVQMGAAWAGTKGGALGSFGKAVGGAFNLGVH